MTRRLAGLLGLAALLSVSGAGAQPKTQPARRPPDPWRAWAVTEGAETRLVVEGVYSQGGPGTVVLVSPAAPQGINPKVLMLNVRTATLPGVWPAVLTPVPAHYTRAPYKAGTYTSVSIRYPDGTGVVLDRIVDTGAGPKMK